MHGSFGASLVALSATVDEGKFVCKFKRLSPSVHVLDTSFPALIKDRFVYKEFLLVLTMK